MPQNRPGDDLVAFRVGVDAITKVPFRDAPHVLQQEGNECNPMGFSKFWEGIAEGGAAQSSGSPVLLGA